MQNKALLVSVVVPLYYDELVVNELYNRLKKVLVDLYPRYRHEIVFVNDGSTDKTLEMIMVLRKKDESIKIIDLSRNFGHQIAVTAGLEHSNGDAVVIIDSDLQDPPEVISQMLEKWEEGYKVVYGVRAKRKGENFFKLISAKIFYRLLERLSDQKLPLDAGDFRLMSREVVDVLQSMPEGGRYIRGMVAWAGFSQYGLPYERDARYAGETKYTFRKMFSFALDGITGFSDKPLRLTSHLGIFITIVAFLATALLIINKLFYPEAGIPGWTSIIAVVLFMGGVQLVSIGILGEYVGRVFRETKRRPLYVISKSYGIDAYVKETKAAEKKLSGVIEE